MTEQGKWLLKMSIINFIIGLLAAISSAMLGYWIQDRDPPTNLIAITIDNDPVMRGGVIKVRHNFIRNRACHVRLQQFVWDSQNQRLVIPAEEYIADPGAIGEENFLTFARLPVDMHPGPARYRAVRAYYCNPLHSWADWPIILAAPDVEFNISDQRDSSLASSNDVRGRVFFLEPSVSANIK